MITAVAGHKSRDVMTMMVTRMIRTMTHTSKMCFGRGNCVGSMSPKTSMLFLFLPKAKKKKGINKTGHRANAILTGDKHKTLPYLQS